MQEETTKKTVAVAVQAAEITGEVLQNVIRIFLQKKEQGPASKKMTLKKLVKQGKKLTNIELRTESMKDFEKVAKKYHVAYAVMQNDTKGAESIEHSYLIFFKCDDAERMDLAFQKYAAMKLSPSKEKPSLKERLEQARRTVWKKTMEKVHLPRREERSL